MKRMLALAACSWVLLGCSKSLADRLLTAEDSAAAQTELRGQWPKMDASQKQALRLKLIGVIADPSLSIERRFRAIEAVGAIGPEGGGVTAMLPLLNDASIAQVWREQIIGVLIQMGPGASDAVVSLAKIVNESPVFGSYPMSAMDGLAAIGVKSLSALADIEAAHPNASIRDYAGQARAKAEGKLASAPWP